MFFRRLIPLLLSLLPLASLADTPPPNPYAETLIAKARELKLADDPYWHILLHYRPRVIIGLFGAVKSEIDAPEFFNAENGRTQPEAELAATIRAFFEPVPADPEQQQAQCRFIDRYRWLQTQLGSFDPDKLPAHACVHYEEWRRALDPESVTVVFSSYFMNNPSSMFGHTLLRLNHRGTQSRLLDYGVNYAANPTTYNAFLYGFLGLVGGFKGDFSNIPYYLKVQEYSDHESRDLWEYDLTLDAAAIDRMMTHLWSVGKVQVSYYFMDRNCSYMLLTLLDAADPKLKLAEDFQGPWVIPADTVRAMAKRPGLLGAFKLRQSITAKVKLERAALSEPQRAAFVALIDEDLEATARAAQIKAIAAGPADQAAPVLDTTIDYVKLLRSSKKGRADTRLAAFNKELLDARSGIDRKPLELSPSVEHIERNRPDRGHPTRRFEGAYGYSTLRKSYLEFGYRGSFHDMNGNGVGYPPNAQIETMQLMLRYYPRDRWIRVERADLVSILSLSPLDPQFKRMSWSARIGIDPVRDVESGLSLEYKGNVAGGVSVEPLRGQYFYALARAELALSGGYVPLYRLGPAAVGGAHLTLADWLGIEGSALYARPLLGFTNGYYQATAQARVSTSDNTEARFQWDLSRTEHQGKFIFYAYF